VPLSPFFNEASRCITVSQEHDVVLNSKRKRQNTYSQRITNKMQHLTVYFCKTLYMFQTVFPSISRRSKLHIQRQVFARPILLPAPSLAFRSSSVLKTAHTASGICHTNTGRCMCSFELLMMDGKTV